MKTFYSIFTDRRNLGLIVSELDKVFMTQEDLGLEKYLSWFSPCLIFRRHGIGPQHHTNCAWDVNKRRSEFKVTRYYLVSSKPA